MEDAKWLVFNHFSQITSLIASDVTLTDCPWTPHVASDGKKLFVTAGSNLIERPNTIFECQGAQVFISMFMFTSGCWFAGFMALNLSV